MTMIPDTTVTVTGTVVDPIDHRRSPAGVDWCQLTVTVAKGKGKERKVMVFDVVVRDDTARNLAHTNIRPGDRVIVYGQIDHTRRRRPSGQPYEAVRILAYDIAPSLKHVALT